MAEHPLGTYIVPQLTPQPLAWEHPMASNAPLPEAFQGSLAHLNEPGITQPLPMREMTPEELVQHEFEHERTKLREWIASARRSIDPAQKNEVHEAAVAAEIERLEGLLAAVGT